MSSDRSLVVAFSHLYLVSVFVVGNSLLAVLNNDVWQARRKKDLIA